MTNHKIILTALRDRVNKLKEDFEIKQGKDGRFFEEIVSIKNNEKNKCRGNWGYTPDLVIKRMKDDKIFIVEIEWSGCGSPAKIIEDIILSNAIPDNPTLIMIIRKDWREYINGWVTLLMEKYQQLASDKLIIIECMAKKEQLEISELDAVLTQFEWHLKPESAKLTLK